MPESPSDFVSRMLGEVATSPSAMRNPTIGIDKVSVSGGLDCKVLVAGYGQKIVRVRVNDFVFDFNHATIMHRELGEDDVELLADEAKISASSALAKLYACAITSPEIVQTPED